MMNYSYSGFGVLAGGNVDLLARVEACVVVGVGRGRVRVERRVRRGTVATFMSLLEPYRLRMENRNLANQLAKTQSDSHNTGLTRLSMEQNHRSSLTCKAPS